MKYLPYGSLGHPVLYGHKDSCGEGGGAGIALVGGVVDGTLYGAGARASVLRGQTRISWNR